MEKIFNSLTELRKQLEEYLEDKLIDDNDPTLNQILATIDSLCVELFQKKWRGQKAIPTFLIQLWSWACVLFRGRTGFYVRDEVI